MRKIKFFLAMALCVFLFSGCGGSKDNSSSSSSSTLHSKVSGILTGTWVFDESSGYSGKGVITGTTTSIYLAHVTDLKAAFSDISFATSADESAGTASVFYSHTVSARDANLNSLGNLTIRSYTSSSATTKTQNMILTRITDDQWTFSYGSVMIIVNFISGSSNKINIQISGTGYLSSVGSYCDYTVECSMIKTSSTPTTDDESTDEETDTTDTTVSEILEGNWKLITEDEATATSTTQGTDRVLTLKLATDIYMKIASINLEADSSTTSQTGTAKVTYAQKWTAFDENEVQQGNAGDFSFSKDDTMKLAKVSDGVWRIEDINNANENIVITITSATEISTVWQGTATTLDNDSYYYSITSSFRKE